MKPLTGAFFAGVIQALHNYLIYGETIVHELRNFIYAL